MYKLVCFGISAMFCCVAIAQQPNQPSASASQEQAALASLNAMTSKVNLVGVNGQNCPIVASAQRGGGLTVVQTRKGEPAHPQNELKLHFGAMNRSGVAEATIFLHGTDSRPRAELANSFSPSMPELTEAVHLTGSADHALTSASVNPSRVVNVRWIGISELRFVDGTVWQSSANSYCRIQPSGFHLVSGTE